MQLWQEWWVWVAAGMVMAMLEVLVSGYVFLGFAVGAVITGLMIWLGLLGATIGPIAFVFAIASLVGWWVLKRLLGLPSEPRTIIDRDINDN